MNALLRYPIRSALALFIIPKNLFLYSLGCKKPSSSPVVNDLCAQGFHVFPEAIATEEVEKLKSIYQEMFDRIPVATSGQSNGRIMMPHLKSDVIRSYVDKFLPVAKEYFDHDGMQVELSMFQKSKVETDVDNIPGGGYHTDDNKKNVKFFIYLTDVTDKNGPFILSPNTHGPRTLRRILRWIGWEITTKRKYFYLDELPEWAPAPIPVLGKAGTVFCADTTIYHKASRVEEGERLVLVISFAEKRLDPYRILLGEARSSGYQY